MSIPLGHFFFLKFLLARKSVTVKNEEISRTFLIENLILNIPTLFPPFSPKIDVYLRRYICKRKTKFWGVSTPLTKITNGVGGGDFQYIIRGNSSNNSRELEIGADFFFYIVFPLI